jgi:hypothetical protein
MKEATRATWVERIEEWKKSGKTAAEFAEGRPFSGGTLMWRASQLRRSVSSGSERRAKHYSAKTSAKIALAQVVRRAPHVRNGLVLEVANVRIAVQAGFDKALLRDVVGALQTERA